MSNHYLSGKLPSYLLRLEREYARDQNSLHSEIIQSCRATLIEETVIDNLDGGTYGHDACLFIPLDVHAKIPLSQLRNVAEALRDDLANLSYDVPYEFFRAVLLEVNDENDSNYQKAVPFLKRAPLNPNVVSFWTPGQIRLFVSHRDDHKAAANDLARALSAFGISSFVAHDTIKPLSEWRHEILKGLETMEIMLVFLTDDFDMSYWTQQEVGFALGKNIPIISLKLQKKDPPGFISHQQAQKGSFADPANSALSIYKLISEQLGAQQRLDDGLVSAFVSSEDYNQARYRFDRMASTVSSLTDLQLASIIRGYRDNKVLSDAYYLANKNDRLVTYLRKITGVEYKIEDRKLVPIVSPATDDLDDDIPF